MYTAKSIVPAVQDLAGEWVKHAAEGTAAQTDAVVDWALSRINHADVPSVVHGVMMTLTGNRKTAKRARRTAGTAVKRATRALRRSKPGGRSGAAAWVALIAAAGLCVGAALAWRMMVPQDEPAPVPAGSASGGSTHPGPASPDQDATNMDKVPFNPVPPVE